MQRITYQRYFFVIFLHISKIITIFGTPLPLRGGFPPKIHSHSAVYTQRMGVFLPVLCTPFSVRIYTAFMQAYAAYRRPQNIEFYSIWQKKHPFICVCAKFVVSLQPILGKSVSQRIFPSNIHYFLCNTIYKNSSV